MPTFRDARGESVTAADGDVVRQYDDAVEAYLGARADARDQVDAVLAADPDCVLGHCLDGYFRMLASKRESTLQAHDALEHAHRAAARRRVTNRERAHVDALDAWSRGDMRGAVDRWQVILRAHPRDIVAIKVSQFVLSYLGASEAMRDLVASVLPAWDSLVPGYGFLLGCYAYGLEEAGDYAQADEYGRRAVALNPADIWAAHAVAHVAEMEGRVEDGLAWIGHASADWRACNNFAAHLHWHEGLFHLDLDQHDRVVELYDRDVRSRSTDEYLDVTNAVSLLWRLEQAEVAVGGRWHELAERARDHIDDHSLVFVDLHYLMALAADNDVAAVQEFLDSSERFAAAGRLGSNEAVVMADVGLPLARAVWAHRRGLYTEAVDELLPLHQSLGGHWAQVRRIGGSHAQRDLFEQLLIDAAWRGRRLDLAAELLAERTMRRPRNIWGWKQSLTVLTATRSPKAAAAARALDALRNA